jgi:predicted DNA-binding transcriptional regulator AlpA
MWFAAIRKSIGTLPSTGAAVCASAVTRAEASSTPIELRPSVSSSEQIRPHATGRCDDADAPRDPAAFASAARTITVAAAAYIGISPSLFDIMVKDGRMPKPKRINARTVWDRKRLDDAFDALPDEEGGNPPDGAKSTNPWDEVAA